MTSPDTRALNVARSALVSGVQYAAGLAIGSTIDSLAPAPTTDVSTTQLMLEVFAQAALTGAVVAVSDRTMLASIDPDDNAGGGMYFLGLVHASPSLTAKAGMLVSRARRVARNVFLAPSKEERAEQNETEGAAN